MSKQHTVPVLLMAHSLGHGGSERQLAGIALNLDRGRFTPHVATAFEGFRAEELRRAGVPILQLPLRSFHGLSTLTAAHRLRSYIRQHQIRLVHTFDYTMSLLGVPVARSCRQVAVLSSQRFYMDLVPAKYRRALLATHRLAAGVVANCEAMRRHLADCYSYPANRIHVCYNGVDTAQFFSSRRKRLVQMEDATLVAGAVCVLRAEKNLGQMLEAFRSVKAEVSELRLLVVGSGPERDGLRMLADDLGIGQACVFLPATAGVGAILRGIDVFVHPSLSEGLPNAVMEAMACGCCVIASRVGGCAELIQAGVNGLLVEPNDLDGLTLALRSVIRDEELRQRLATAAAEHMKSFSIEKAAERMGQIYERYLL